MGEVKSYRDLTVWQRSMELATMVYGLVGGYPKYEEYGLSSQTRRCAVSIPSNIAEGYGRGYTKEYCRFLDFSRGSLYELQTQIEIATRLNYIEDKSFTEVQKISVEIEKMLNSLISKLRNAK